MNKEKQIEEMAKVICAPTANKGNCEKCGFKKHCSKFDDATDLYNAGYRKVPDVAREICAEIGNRFESLLEMLPADGALTDAKTFIEAHWEFIEHSIVYAYDAELKKKYTEGEE